MDKKQFYIDQLRKDKIIFATETTATILICILMFQFSNQYIKSPLKDTVNIFALVLAVSQKVIQAIVNIKKWNKIIKLEKDI